MMRGGNGLPDPTNVQPFINGAAGPVQLRTGPNGDLFYVDFNGGRLHRIVYTGTGTNRAPTAAITADPTSGNVPLTVSFSGTGSTDPDGDPLTYAWDLDGDGAYDDSTAAEPSFTYTNPGNVPVGLRVSDPGAQFDTDSVTISATGSVQYVSDLPFVSSTNGWGPVERDRSNGEQGAADGRTLTLNGATYAKGVGTHAASDVRVADPLRLHDLHRRHRPRRRGRRQRQRHLPGLRRRRQPVHQRHQAWTRCRPGHQRQRLRSQPAAAAWSPMVATARTPTMPTGPMPSSPAVRPEATRRRSRRSHHRPRPSRGTSGRRSRSADRRLTPRTARSGADSLDWSVLLFHCTDAGCHSHPVQDFPGTASGSMAAPDHDYPSYLEVRLTATDSDGASTVVTRRIDPETVDLTFASVPSGLRVTVGSTTHATPFTRTVIVGSRNSIGTSTRQSVRWTSYAFSSWSDGGARVHNITAPATPTTYTATFSASGTGSVQYVSDLPFVSSTNGWGPVERDRSNGEQGAADGRTLTLNGATYAKGVGTHAASDVRVAIPSGCTTFTAVIGLDDEVGANGSVTFQVFGDADQPVHQRHQAWVRCRPGHQRQRLRSQPAAAGGRQWWRQRGLRPCRLGRRQARLRLRARRSARPGAREVLDEPAVAREVLVLLGAETVAEPVRRKRDVVVGQDGVLGDVAQEGAALGQAFGEVAPGPHLVRVHGLAVRRVSAVLVEDFAGTEVPLCAGTDLDDRAAEWRSHFVAEEGDARDRVRDLEVHEVIGDREGVERAVAHLVELQVVLLLRVGVLGEDEDLHPGRSDRVVDHAASLAQDVEVIEARQLLRVVIELEPARHPALQDAEARGVGDDRLLEADLRPIGEARDHVRVLAPLAGKALLRGRVPISVLEALDVPDDARDQSEAAHPAHEVQLQARLIALAGGHDHARLAGLHVQDRADGRVDLRIHQHDVRSVGERLEDDVRAEFDGSGHVDEDVDLLGSGQQQRVVGDRRPARANGVLERRLVVDAGDVVDARVAEDVQGALRVAGWRRPPSASPEPSSRSGS